MNASRIVYCLFDIMKIDLTDFNSDRTLQEEREIAQYLAEMINSLCNRKQFEYKEETTLDFYQDDYDSDEDDEIEDGIDKVDSDNDYEVEDDVNAEHHKLSNYSIEFMQQVVDFAYETDEFGKRRRTWKSVHRRFELYHIKVTSADLRSIWNRMERDGKKHSKSIDLFTKN